MLECLEVTVSFRDLQRQAVHMTLGSAPTACQSIGVQEDVSSLRIAFLDAEKRTMKLVVYPINVVQSFQLENMRRI